MVTIANANTTLQIDNDFHFEIFYNKKGKIFPLTEKSKTHPSLFLCDSINEKILFSRKAVQLNKINDAYGNGEKVKIEAVSRDGMIKCFISFSCYNNWPEIFLVKASFLNISESNYFIRNYSLNRIILRHPYSNQPEWWTFQGSSNRGGIDDFIFPLPQSFSSDNHMGYSIYGTSKDGKGGGIPLIDFWNKEFGVALACLAEKPPDVFLPVKAENGVVTLSITENYRKQVLAPRR